MTRLKGQVALVTGAASGIGYATALRFAAEGAQVAAVDLNEAALTEAVETINANEAEAVPVAADVSDSAQVRAAIQKAMDTFGHLDIIFNGVGVSGRRWGDGPVADCTEDAWARTLNVNLTSMFLVCKFAVPYLLRAGGGAIVNLSSVLGIVGGDDDFATHAYAASKAGIIGLSRAMAVYYAPRGIRVNVIAPSLIATPMSQRAQSDPHILGRLKDLQPLTGAFGRPEDVAAAAAYLASDDARFVTGAVLAVDGGWTAQ
jgi:NAD(P)-dependent dehydrogenase (short-subunit alcohol dehydrogenase family)